MGGFVRRSDEIEILLDDDERRLVALALRILEDVDVEVGGVDPAADRLRYSAHPDDREADERFRRLTAGLLDEARRHDRHVLSETLHAGRMTEEHAEAWLRVIGEARLALAARAGITEDGWEERFASSQTPPADLIIISLMAELQDDLVRALLG